MPGKKSLMSLALGSAIVATLGTASIASAADSPFTAQPLNKGYMVADAQGYGESYGKSGEGRCGMSMADTDKDGRVSREEHARHCDMMFNKMDTNKDGYIDKDEMENWRKMHGYRHGARPGYTGQWSDNGGRYTHYGERGGDHYLPHMKPMDE
ncbi:MAG: EF-hand domain-containing protein [Betaproteobacteria bacterium]|nr:EF-hand domain-containing protein [Betaproteobacteria bacterium]